MISSTSTGILAGFFYGLCKTIDAGVRASMSVDSVLESLYASIGRILVAGGGGAVVAYGIFTFFGRDWLNGYFNKQLERFKHDQQIELEQLRHRINALFSRVSKIHEKEFEVLPRAWQLLHEAHGAIFAVTEAFRQWPDLDRMSEQQLNEFLSESKLAEFQKLDLRNLPNKLSNYQEAMFWHELNAAKTAQTNLNNYIVLNSIFMTDALRQQFKEINRSLAGVLLNAQFTHRNPDRDAGKSTSKTMDEISEMFGQIEAAVQERLRYEDA